MVREFNDNGVEQNKERCCEFSINRKHKLSIIMRYLIIIVSCFLTLEASAQKCDRPEEVFIKLSALDSTIVFNCLGNPERRIYLRDSSEVFIQTSKLKEVVESEYCKIPFQTISQLRKKEIEIVRCEARKADKTVYLDININSVFKKIFMVTRREGIIYKFQVHWIDGIE